MMVARRKRKTGSPPEEKETSKVINKNIEEHRSGIPVVSVENNQNGEESNLEEPNADREFPFKESENIADVEIPKVAKGGSGFQNWAPLQADERARELLRSTLQHPISLTVEDLLNISELVRNELKRLLTKKH